MQMAEEVLRGAPVEGEGRERRGGGGGGEEEGRGAFEGMEALARAIETGTRESGNNTLLVVYEGIVAPFSLPHKICATVRHPHAQYIAHIPHHHTYIRTCTCGWEHLSSFILVSVLCTCFSMYSGTPL